LAEPAYSRSLDDCEGKAKTQAELNACADTELTRVDNTLNSLFKRLIAEASADDSDAVPSIRRAERAWRSYRDAYIEAAFPGPNKQENFGTEYPMQVALLRISLTKHHIDEIENLEKLYTEQ
jgi:uncharacterized protein YecT (DUF1311 family)